MGCRRGEGAMNGTFTGMDTLARETEPTNNTDGARAIHKSTPAHGSDEIGADKIVSRPKPCKHMLPRVQGSTYSFAGVVNTLERSSQSNHPNGAPA